MTLFSHLRVLPLVTGAAIAITMSSNPAQAALFNFNFQSNPDVIELSRRNGSITFDSSVPDSDSDPERGEFLEAIQGYEFTLGNQAFSGSGGDIFIVPASAIFPELREIFFVTDTVGFGFVYSGVDLSAQFLPTQVPSTTFLNAEFTSITPVPEPTTVAVLGLGACLLLYRDRSHIKSK